jgi:hypothetical protein
VTAVVVVGCLDKGKKRGKKKHLPCVFLFPYRVCKREKKNGLTFKMWAWGECHGHCMWAWGSVVAVVVVAGYWVHLLDRDKKQKGRTCLFCCGIRIGCGGHRQSSLSQFGHVMVDSGDCGCRVPEQKEKKKPYLFFFLVSVSGEACTDAVGEVAGASMGGLNKR